MGIVRDEEIRSYRIGELIVCPECVEADELRNFKQGHIIDDDEIEKSDTHYFCERCENEL